MSDDVRLFVRRQSKDRDMRKLHARDQARPFGAADKERKRRARNAVRYALEAGTLEKGPCEVCGDPVTQAHHDDYEKPLTVRWLCTVHHAPERKAG